MENFLATFFGVIAGFILSIYASMTESKIFYYSKQKKDKEFVDKILRKIDRENWEIINTLNLPNDWGKFICKRTKANRWAYLIYRGWRCFKIKKYPKIKREMRR